MGSGGCALGCAEFRAGQTRILAWGIASADLAARNEMDHGTWLSPFPIRSMISIVTKPSSSGSEIVTSSDDST